MRFGLGLAVAGLSLEMSLPLAHAAGEEQVATVVWEKACCWSR
jgi:hypothetical protein